MKEQLLQFLNQLSDYLSVHQNYKLIFYALLVIVFIYVLDSFIKFIIIKGVKKAVNQSSFAWDKVFYQKKVFHTLAHLVSFSIGFLLTHFVFDDGLNKSIKLIDKFFEITITIIFIQLFIRLIDAFMSLANAEENSYKTVAVRTFTQFLKIIVLILGFIAIVSIFFNVSLGSLITSISAVTAVLLLVFRDTIVGFVSGIQISSSEIMKLGDWVYVEKYNLEGVVKEINLVTTKIESFDKTISSIPTYDILSSKLKNLQPTVDSNKRRMVRSIPFDSKSFHYLSNQKILELKTQFPLLQKYAEEQKQMDNENNLFEENKEITNMGLFRAYTQLYLENHPKISKSEVITVRQLPMTDKGVPMQVYCFVKTAIWVEYEKIVSDLFDHLMIISRDFELEIYNK